ncbi:unnamed protein product [Prunus armeniaca]|uniref:Uncharacterized protein n=1 Tax=Prunus armeniaca TaxID=36596 RepID=A0A6J5WFL0_PRUAR|nr:unnamed protein product [Prunus armeniaca]
MGWGEIGLWQGGSYGFEGAVLLSIKPTVQQVFLLVNSSLFDASWFSLSILTASARKGLLTELQSPPQLSHNPCRTARSPCLSARIITPPLGMARFGSTGPAVRQVLLGVIWRGQGTSLVVWATQQSGLGCSSAPVLDIRIVAGFGKGSLVSVRSARVEVEFSKNCEAEEDLLPNGCGYEPVESSSNNCTALVVQQGLGRRIGARLQGESQQENLSPWAFVKPWSRLNQVSSRA